mgnify:CR=1 FL=1
MKKHETKITADHFEALLVRHEMEPDDMITPDAIPENYLMIGPPGGPLARISGSDVAIVGTLLQFAETQPLYRLRAPRGVHPV